jgi:hypothetical protein
MVHSIDLLTSVNFIITCDDFEVTNKVVKAQCIVVACDLLVIELEHGFSNHELMNALWVIYL